MGLFDGSNVGQVGQVGFGEAIGGELMKALEAGYGTDSATMTGGRALIPQDIEKSVINALAVKKADFKMMNLLKNEKVGSTVHEYTRRDDAGLYQLIFGSEGGNARDTSQTIERVTRLVKYMQTYRQITLQMRVAKTLENAEATEQEAGILTILKGAEYGCFHGDSASSPTQFDSVSTQIMASAGPNGSKNISDLRGQTLQNAGEAALKDCARMIYDNGGYATHAFMPTLLAADLQDVVKDRLRFGTDDTKGTGVIERYPTPFSDAIKIAGDDAGPDKMFFCRNGVSAMGLASTRPNAPTIVGVAAVNAASKFVAADAASYTYEVHAVSEDGISGASVVATVPVTAGEGVSLTITPDPTVPGTGYIICRGQKGATTDLREIGRCAGGTSAVTFVDLNAVLPGTGDVILLSYDGVTPSIQWDSFLPAMKFDLFPTLSAIIPFLIVMFGTPDCKVPWYHGIIRNVSPSGLGWF
jgi:hypothetical protein